MATDPSQLMSMLAQNSGLQGQYFMNGQDQSRKQQFDQQAIALNAAKLSEMQRATDSDAGFQTAWTSYLKNPTTDSLARIAVQYPSHADAVKNFWAIKDPDARQSQLQAIAPVVSLLENNKPADAIAHLRRLRDAAAAGKQPTDDYDQEIEALQSGNKDAINAVKGTLMMHIASIDRDGKFAASLAQVKKSFSGDDPYTLSPGSKRFDGNNAVVAEVPFAPDRFTLGPGQTRYAGDGDVPTQGGGGDIVSRMLPITMKSESGGKDFAPGGGVLTSPKGAQGRMQVMPGTQADPGFGISPARDGSPDERARIGKEYLGKMVERYGNPAQAWAAYNAGPGAVDAAIQKGGGRWLQQLPDETKRYVTRNMSALGNGGGNEAGARVVAQGAPAAGDEAATSIGDPTLSGDAYLATIPPAMRSQVKAIADGRIAVPRTGTKLGSRILDAVTAYDPTFDAANAQSRVKTRVDFTSGKSANATNALNTAMGHLLHLDSQAKDLGNFSTLPGWINPLYNKGRQMAGDTKLPAFNQTKQAAASEMRKVFAGSAGGNLTELEAWEKTLDSSQSYEQLHEVIKNGVTLMGSRLNALQDQYATGMGRSDNVPSMINAKVAEATKKRFGIDLGGAYAPRTSAAPPATGTIRKGYRYDGGDPANRNSWTKVQ